MLIFQGEARFEHEHNHAEIGGAIMAIESEVYMSDQMYI